MIRPSLAVAVFLIAATPVASAAAAKEVTVAYGDLDLGTSAGQSELILRLQEAAAQLCNPVLARLPDSEFSIHEHQILYRACIGRLSERALAEVKIGRN